jgi:hypothetical protein
MMAIMTTPTGRFTTAIGAMTAPSIIQMPGITGTAMTPTISAMTPGQAFILFTAAAFTACTDAFVERPGAIRAFHFRGGWKSGTDRL